MEQKFVLLFTAVAAGHKGVSQACREADISRDTYYRLRRRWEAEGMAGLVARSRAPHHSPSRTSDEVVELIVAARKQLEREGWDNGAISIRCRLLHDGLQHPPCVRTIHRVLTRAGMIEPEPGKRPRSSFKRFVFPATDDCWNIDAFGYHLADPTSTLVMVFEIYDDHSRYNIAELAWPREDTEGAWTAMTMGIDRYGPPRMALADNGLAFTGRRMNIQVLFEKNLALLGIKLINSRPRHPQTNGKNERAHATARRWLAAQPPATTLEELQTLLERYRLEYNQRPHQGIDLDTPLQRRLTGTRPTPPAHTQDTQDVEATQVTQVIEGRATSRDGYLATQNTIIPLGVEYAGQPITAFITGNHALVFYREQLIRQLTLDRTRNANQHYTHAAPNAVPSPTTHNPDCQTCPVTNRQTSPVT